MRTLPGVPTRHSDVDLVIVRENTEGLYSGLEHEVVPGVIETLKVFTEKACTRIAEYAFMLARRDGRRKVSAAHKASIMKMTDGLFLDCCRAVAARHPDIGYEEIVVDTLCMQLVARPDALRRRAAREPLRRHRLRSLLGAGRRARRRAGRQHRRRRPRSSRPCTAARPTSPARTSRTRSR